MPWTEPLASFGELRRCIRDLVALSTLPAGWQNYDMRQIGASIVAALISMLDADFVFIALPGHGNQFVTELARSSPKLDPANLQRVQKKLQQERATLGSGREFMIADVSGGSGLRVMTAPIFRPVERHMATERTVYVLDDDDAVLRSLERLLSSANFKPITFDHPSVFLTAAKTFKTGCVLLDVRLPGMSGLRSRRNFSR
jgi:hypothetical protein